LPAGTVFVDEVRAGHTVFAYVLEGELFFGGEAQPRQPVEAPALVVFADGDLVRAEGGSRGGRFLLAAAKPLREPIARYGPFVMNTAREIEEALSDLRSGRFIREEATDG